MHYSDILAAFLRLFPSYQDKVRAWMPGGGSCIKLDLSTGQRLIFNYLSDRKWTLESDVSPTVRRI